MVQCLYMSGDSPSIARRVNRCPYVQTDSILQSLDLIVKIHLSNVLIPGQRRRQWPSIEPILCIFYVETFEMLQLK